MPAVQGELLHIHDSVPLIHDFVAEYGLDEVLHSDDALEGAVFVDYDGNLFLLLQHPVPDKRE